MEDAARRLKFRNRSEFLRAVIRAALSFPEFDEGVQDDDQIRIVVDNVLIRVDPDGGVVVERDAEKTHLEGSGEIYRFTPDMKINVSADGSRLSRETEDSLDGFTPDGMVSRRK